MTGCCNVVFIFALLLVAIFFPACILFLLPLLMTPFSIVGFFLREWICGMDFL